MGEYMDNIKGWLKHPYNEDGSVWDWVLFAGLWVVATYLWVRVIRDLAE